ncbi:MAG: GFA family protein [Actinobacteria bacterium]|nr:MAG: GFA family protein [Actinomycetota bacterium]
MDEPLLGSCLCGGVSFEITQPFRRVNHCHCSRCRKHSGTTALTQGRVPREGFRLLSGEELIRVYHPEGGMTKAFCSVCGSSLFGGTWPDGPEVSVRFGALDGDPGVRPQYRSFVASKAVWDELAEDGLPRFPGASPDA